jgi:hypothetical protein
MLRERPSEQLLTHTIYRKSGVSILPIVRDRVFRAGGLLNSVEPPFLLPVRFPHATGFEEDGIIKFDNRHQWAEDNPHGVLQSGHQQQYKQVLLLAVW